MSNSKITVGNVVFYKDPEIFGAAQDHFTGPGTVLSIEGDIAKVMWQNGRLMGPAFHHLTSLIPAGEFHKK
jgi:hypothetical protein